MRLKAVPLGAVPKEQCDWKQCQIACRGQKRSIKSLRAHSYSYSYSYSYYYYRYHYHPEWARIGWLRRIQADFGTGRISADLGVLYRFIGFARI